MRTGEVENKQEFRTALFYLNMYDPNHNYLFKANQSRQFMYYIENEDDFGRGKDFSLKKYYDMCDWLVERIKEMPELKQIHRQRLNDPLYDEDDYHILAFDIIWCGVTYNLYSGIEIKKPVHAKNKSEEKHRAPLSQIAALRTQLSEKYTELSEALSELSTYDGFSAVGLSVTHKNFGQGTIVDQESTHIFVKFADGEKKFVIPSSFTRGHLKTEDDEVMQLLSEVHILEAKCTDIRKAIQYIESDIKRLEKVF